MKRPLPALRTPIPAPSKSVRQMVGAYEKNNKKNDPIIRNVKIV